MPLVNELVNEIYRGKYVVYTKEENSNIDELNWVSCAIALV